MLRQLSNPIILLHNLDYQTERFAKVCISRPKVIYWDTIPSPYMVDRWNALADRNKIDLEVWLSERDSSGHQWELSESEWRFHYRYVPRLRVGGRNISLPIVWPRRTYDVFVSLYDQPGFILAFIANWLRRRPTLFWVEVTFDSWITRKAWKEWIKRLMLPRATGIVTPGPDGANFVKSYGVRSERIHYARHSIDAKYFEAEAERLSGERKAIRSGMGVQGITYLYVGRLVAEKGLDSLLSAFKDVLGNSRDVTLLIVGSGPMEAALRQRVMAENILRVMFVSFMQHSELPRVYAAADVFVFPSLGDPYALVIDEAMASGLPIVATSSIGEIDLRIEANANGIIVPPGDTGALAIAMKSLGGDASLRERMGQSSRQRIRESSPDRFAEAFESAVLSVLS